MSDRWRGVVREGYDEVAARYLAERTMTGADVTALAELTEHLDPGSRVLDAGCGAGEPITRHLVDAGFSAVGLDISIKQLELGRDLVPESTAVQGDLAGLPFAAESFDAVVSYYAIIHVPRDDHAAVFAEVRRVLRPGGWSLLCLGAADLPADHDPDSWLGAAMYWSHFDAATNLDLLRDVGLEIASHQEIPDPMGHRGHLFALVRRSDA
jgi:ubiquinone/menaquinone biosynthesis C-methylase UbiE